MILWLFKAVSIAADENRHLHLLCIPSKPQRVPFWVCFICVANTAMRIDNLSDYVTGKEEAWCRKQADSEPLAGLRGTDVIISFKECEGSRDISYPDNSCCCR